MKLGKIIPNPKIASLRGSAMNYVTSPLNAWRGVCYGNGLFVAVASDGTGNRVMTSPDGLTWTSRVSASDSYWRAVIYGNGLFVAVGGSSNGTVMTSPDGINWTARTPASASLEWFTVAYGNGLFVAAGQGGNTMTSPDGINWTLRPTSAAGYIPKVRFADGKFVFIAQSGTNRIGYSVDGINWTYVTSQDAVNLASITFGNGLWVFKGAGGVRSTRDFVTFITGVTPAVAGAVNDGVYADGTFLFLDSAGTVVHVSLDGIYFDSRSSHPLGASVAASAACYADGKIIIVCATGATTRVLVGA